MPARALADQPELPGEVPAALVHQRLCAAKRADPLQPCRCRRARGCPAGRASISSHSSRARFGRDLVGPGGRTLAARGTRITPELVDAVEAARLLPEMIVYMTLPEDER